MFLPVFEGKEYGYSAEKETGQYLLFNNKYNVHVFLKDYDAILFRQYLELLNNQQENNRDTRLEKVITIFLYNFGKSQYAQG